MSRAALVPVRRLTGTAERIAETGEPSERVPVSGRDELPARRRVQHDARALEESLETQRRFVADASHELRTPLTSMQTNIEVLKQQAPIRSESHPHVGEPKKMPTSVDAAMSPLHTGVRPRSAVISGRTTAMMPRSKPSESLADRRRCGHPPQHAHVAPRHEARH